MGWGTYGCIGGGEGVGDGGYVAVAEEGGEDMVVIEVKRLTSQVQCNTAGTCLVCSIR